MASETETKWTPGPWRVASRQFTGRKAGLIDYWVEDASGAEIADAYLSDGYDEPTMLPAEANATLIASSPELYDALNECAVWLETFAASGQSSIASTAAQDIASRARAVLARARGEAS